MIYQRNVSVLHSYVLGAIWVIGVGSVTLEDFQFELPH